MEEEREREKERKKTNKIDALDIEKIKQKNGLKFTRKMHLINLYFSLSHNLFSLVVAILLIQSERRTSTSTRHAYFTYTPAAAASSIQINVNTECAQDGLKYMRCCDECLCL